MMTAKDLMTKDVITVPPSMEIAAAARLLASAHITGAPVVDEAGVVLGIVSQTDLASGMGRRRSDADYARGPVSRVMSKSVVTCEQSAGEEELAELMLRRRVHRVLVTCAGKLCGIVSAMDLLRALLNRSDEKNAAGDCFGRFVAKQRFDGNERRP
jgi:CBS domain-containing protein